jgi:A/G-specific adenine glycosylase
VVAIAFDQRAVVVDANVERVVARLFAIDTPLPGGRKAIRAAAETITPDRRPGDFAQGMMDLGSTICTPRAPKCLLCPVAEDCAGRQTGKPERFPVKPVKRALPERAGQAYWIERENHVWLVTRPPDGLFGGMRALPDDGWSAQKDGSGEPPLPGEWAMLGTVRHSFTHAKLTLTILSGTSDAAPPGKGDWWPLEQLTQAGLPTLFANASRLVLAR